MASARQGGQAAEGTKKKLATDLHRLFLARVAFGDTQISRSTEEIDLMRMHPGIAQKLNGELLRDKNKPARSCHQESPISPDLSGPHAVRGLLSDLYRAHSDNIRGTRAKKNNRH